LLRHPRWTRISRCSRFSRKTRSGQGIGGIDQGIGLSYRSIVFSDSFQVSGYRSLIPKKRYPLPHPLLRLQLRREVCCRGKGQNPMSPNVYLYTAVSSPVTRREAPGSRRPIPSLPRRTPLLRRPRLRRDPARRCLQRRRASFPPLLSPNRALPSSGCPQVVVLGADQLWPGSREQRGHRLLTAFTDHRFPLSAFALPFIFFLRSAFQRSRFSGLASHE